MVNKKIKFLFTLIILSIIVMIFMMTSHSNYTTFRKEVDLYEKLVTIRFFSEDGKTFEKYNGDTPTKEQLEEKYLYYVVDVKETVSLDKIFVIESKNANIKMYRAADFVLTKKIEPILVLNNVITAKDTDVTYFNLADYSKQSLVFEFEKIDSFEQMNITSYGVVSKTALEKYKLKLIQVEMFSIGVAIATMIFVFTMSLYKIFRLNYLRTILALLFFALILYISTGQFLSFYIYPNVEIWVKLQDVSILFLNSLAFYYVYKIDRQSVRKLATVFLYTSYVFSIIMFAVSFFRDVYDMPMLEVVLITYSVFSFVLIYRIYRKYFRHIKSLLNNKKVLVRKLGECFSLFSVIFLNVVIILNRYGLITRNTMNDIFLVEFIIAYFSVVGLCVLFLLAIKYEHDELPTTLKKADNIFSELNIQQNILYGKENIDDIILSVFVSTEALIGQKISGYYVLTNADGKKTIIHGYGKFAYLTGKDYSKLKKNEKSNKKKGWYIFNGEKNRDGTFVEIFVLPSKIINQNDSLMLNTFFNVGYEVTKNFILLRDMFQEEKELIISLTEISEIRSKETGGHIKRVSEYSRFIGEKLGLSEDELEILVLSSQMHDLGKLCIPDEILHKPGKLTNEEFDVIKTHAMAGYTILNNCTGKYLERSKIIARDHHEKYNGRGYYGLKGEEIDLFGRIVAVADVFDALMTKRSYKDAWELDRVIDLFKEERGEHFDPIITDIFLNNVDEFAKIQKKYV